MSNYYNFKQTENSLSYEPYFYDKGNSKVLMFSGIALMIIGVFVSVFKIWNEALYVGFFLGSVLLLNGLYRFLIEGKTTLEFHKPSDALYKTTPFGKKKKIALSNIYDIITVTEDINITYEITRKDKPNAKSIEISSFIDESRSSKPEVFFFENEIIPAVFSFLQLESKNSDVSEIQHYN